MKLIVTSRHDGIALYGRCNSVHLTVDDKEFPFRKFPKIRKELLAYHAKMKVEELPVSILQAELELCNHYLKGRCHSIHFVEQAGTLQLMLLPEPGAFVMNMVAELIWLSARMHVYGHVIVLCCLLLAVYLLSPPQGICCAWLIGARSHSSLISPGLVYRSRTWTRS